jgi:aminotransferase in exopolysaccharide biosynthesis
MAHEFIPLSVPNLKGNELEYISNAVRTEWVSTGGPFVNDFEREVALYAKCKGAVSCQNGTSGLHIALQLCDVQRNEEVIVPALTFIAAVNPVKYIGAEPVFMDCDDTLTMDPQKLRDFCANECSLIDQKLINRKTKKQIKALIIVHVFGNMADMVSIRSIAEEYHLRIIEDATEAMGTYYTEGIYKGHHAGTIGDIGVYSFNGNKIITTGGGGMIVSNNEEFLKKAKHLTTQAKSDELYYTHDAIGYNYRMTNLQAALGLAQLEQLEQFIETKKENYFHYKKKIETIANLHLLDFRQDIRPNYWFYALYLEQPYPLNRDQMIPFLGSKNVQVRPIWGLIPDQPPYENNQVYEIECAKDYLEHVINIPCSSNLTTEDVDYVAACLAEPTML